MALTPKSRGQLPAGALFGVRADPASRRHRVRSDINPELGDAPGPAAALISHVVRHIAPHTAQTVKELAAVICVVPKIET